jgi:hypothetical protein
MTSKPDIFKHARGRIADMKVLPPEFYTKNGLTPVHRHIATQVLLNMNSATNGVLDGKPAVYFKAETIGGWTGCKRRTIYTALSKLDKAGILHVRARAGRSHLIAIGDLPPELQAAVDASREAARARAKGRKVEPDVGDNGGDF